MNTVAILPVNTCPLTVALELKKRTARNIAPSEIVAAYKKQGFSIKSVMRTKGQYNFYYKITFYKTFVDGSVCLVSRFLNVDNSMTLTQWENKF